MQLRFIGIIIGILFFVNPLQAEKAQSAEWLFLSMPKSGSHLLLKVFHLFDELNKEYVPIQGGHLFYPGTPIGMNAETEPFWKTKKKLILVRDLRDVVVSAAFWFTKYHPDRQDWMRLSFDQKLTAIIEETLSPPFSFISDNIRMLKFHLDSPPECCIIHFENLVGLKGGSTLEKQATEFYKIADFLDLELSPTEIEYLSENLFGLREQDKVGVQTYRSGQIGEWKKYFQPHHIKLFNEKFGDSMRLLGYCD